MRIRNGGVDGKGEKTSLRERCGEKLIKGPGFASPPSHNESPFPIVSREHALARSDVNYHRNKFHVALKAKYI